MPDAHPVLNRPAPNAIDLLLSRRSGSAKAMTGPGPDHGQLETILKAAARVPDHGKLFPWRFIVFEGEARARFGDILAACLPAAEATDERRAIERGRFLRAPVAVGVISRVREGIPIPVWEQQLSAGAACQTLLIAATAMGFVANWITEWAAYDPCVAQHLDLQQGERVAGFIYIGRPAQPLEERVRPEMDKIVRWF
ncbi:MAG: nitroreductase [Alphaproteobacteria bacterium]|nr:nitroreductase [Alphaproteobacteria bacterium]MBV9693817.1 nitroreductase [Alphaproteobacteria bacterium]